MTICKIVYVKAVIQKWHQNYPSAFSPHLEIEQGPVSARNDDVLVYSGCYITKYQNGQLIISGDLFLAVLEAGNLSSWFDGVSFLVHRFVIGSSNGRKGEETPWGLFYKTTNSIHEGETHMTCFLTPLLWTLGFQHVNFEGDMSIQIIAGQQ